MQQGANVGAFLTRKPIAPSSGVGFRADGERIADELRGALIVAAKSCERYPAPELMERIRPERGRNISFATFWEAALNLANAPTLRMPAWRGFAATVVGACESLVIAPHACHLQAWGTEQEAQRSGDRTQECVFLNWEHATVAQLNDAIVAIDYEIDAKRQLRAHLVAQKAASLTTRGAIAS